MRHSLVVTALTVLVLRGTIDASAQGLISPSSHFGTLAFPSLEEQVHFGLHLDRFTNFGKDTLADGSWDPTPYNGIDHAIGFNSLSYSASRKLGAQSTTLVRVQTSFGYIGEEPTKFLQNHVIHDLKGLARVPAPRGDSGIAAGLSLEVNKFFPSAILNGSALTLAAPAFIGAGGLLSNVSSDVFLHVGVRSESWTAHFGEYATELPSLSAMLRVGHQQGGEHLQSQYLTKLYFLSQFAVKLPLSHWWSGLGVLPDIEYTRSSDSYFRGISTPGSSGKPLDERFCGIALKWSNLMLGHWNDSCANKDKGPTYGVPAIWEMPGNEANVLKRFLPW